MTKKSKRGHCRPSIILPASKKLKAKKRKALAREAALHVRIKKAAATFELSTAAKQMTTLDAATFFARLDSYPRFTRSHAMERRGRRDLFVAIYELIVGLGERINSAEFTAAAMAQAREFKGLSLHPAAIVLRRGMRYEDRWRGLPDADQPMVRKSAMKLASQDFAAMRWVLSKGYSVAEVRRRLTAPGDGMKAWEKAWRRRNGDGDPRPPQAPQAMPAKAPTGASSKKRPVEPDFDWMVEQLCEALSDRLPVDFPVDVTRGFFTYVQTDRGPLGEPLVVGARRLGSASRFLGKDGANRLRKELKALKRSAGSARRA